MNSKILRIFYIPCFLIIVISISLFYGCNLGYGSAQANGYSYQFSRSALSAGEVSFRDIPGITAEEILVIESFQRSGTSFTYGIIHSTEAFVENNQVRGFAAHFSEWLTLLFGIPFNPVLYEWGDLVYGLEHGEIDFTGELTATEEHSQIYYMTDPIASRSIKYIRHAGSQPLYNIVAARTPHYAFLDGAITMEFVDRFTRYVFESVFVNSYEEAYNLLITGEIDAFFNDSSMEAVFDVYDDVFSSDFIPVIGIPVSLSTQNPSL